LEYNLKINKSTVPVNVDIKEDRRLKISVGRESYYATYTVISGNQLFLEINGKVFNIFLAGKDADSKTIVVNGRPFYVEEVDDLSRRSTGRKSRKDLPREVTPPMPAVVTRLLVNKGDPVRKGDAIIVVSAMKMETTLTAPYSGIVARIHVGEGDKVSPGQILVDIEENE